jgi:tetratricopeptide (TPR) repeat protein
MAFLIAVLAHEQPRLRKVAAGIVLVGVIGSAGFGWLLYANNAGIAQKNTLVQAANQAPLFGTLATIDLTSVNSATTRFYTAWIGLRGFSDRPILGWGQGNYQYVFSKYYMPEIYGREPWFDRAHNVFVDWLVQGGVLGFFAYMAMWAALLWLIWRDPRENWPRSEKIVLTGLIVGYFVHNIFVFDSITSYIIFFALLAYVAARTIAPESKPLFGERSAKPIIAYGVAAPLAIVLMGSITYAITLQPARASQDLISALSYAKADRYQQSLSYYQQAIGYGTFGNQEIREQLVSTARGLANRSNVSSQAFFRYADQQLKTHTSRFPNEARAYQLWGTMLGAYGKHERAASVFSRAHELAPRKPSFIMQLGQTYLVAGKYQKAAETLKKAVDMDVEIERAYMMYAAALRYQGKEKEAQKVLSAFPKEKVLFNDWTVRPYNETGRYQEALSVHRRRLEVLNERLANARAATSSSAQPENKVVRDIVKENAAIADLYQRMGRIEQAASHLEQLKERFPKYSSHIEQFLNRLRSRGGQ